MKKAISLLIFLLCLAMPIHSDVIVFSDGERHEGIVREIKAEPDFIIFSNSTGEIKVPRSKVHKIIKEDLDVSLMKIGNQYFERQDYNNALEQYKRALKLKPDSEDIQQRIRLTELELKKIHAQERKQQLQEVAQLISEAQELAGKERYDEATKLLAVALDHYPSEEQKDEIRRLKIDIYYKWGLYDLDRLNRYGAVTSFEQVLQLDPKNKQAMDKILEIWESEPTQVDKLIDIYDRKLSHNPDDADIMFKLANALFNKKDYEKSLEYYLKLYKDGRLNESLYIQRLRNLFTTLYTSAARNNDYLKAKHYYQQYAEIFPDVDPTVTYLYEYAYRLSQLDPDDLEGRVKLAQYCKEHHLDAQAKREYKAVLRKDPKNEKALAGLNTYALKDLEEARFFFDEKQYPSAIDMANKIMEEYNSLSEIVRQASDILTMAQNEQRKIKRERTKQALDLARQGEQYFNRAEAYINAMKDSQRRRNVRVVDDKSEAIKYLRRAIKAWEMALTFDPSLAAMDKEDLANKLSDARQRLNVLESPVPLPMPRPKRPRSSK